MPPGNSRIEPQMTTASMMATPSTYDGSPMTSWASTASNGSRKRPSASNGSDGGGRPHRSASHISGSKVSLITNRDKPNELRTTLGVSFESQHLIAAAGELNDSGELVVEHKIGGTTVEHKLSQEKSQAVRPAKA